MGGRVVGRGWLGRGGSEQRIGVFVKIQNKKKMGGGVELGGQGRCEPRSEVIVKNKKKSGVGVGRIRLRGQGGCEQRIEIIVKMQMSHGKMSKL